jgi:hypothetical protein
VSIKHLIFKTAAVAFAASSLSSVALAAATPFAGDYTFLGTYSAGQVFQFSNSSVSPGSIEDGKTNVDKWVFDVSPPGKVSFSSAVSFNPSRQYVAPFGGVLFQMEGGTCSTIGVACTSAGSAIFTEVVKFDEFKFSYLTLDNQTLDPQRYMIKLRYTPNYDMGENGSYTGDGSFKAVPAPAALGLLGIGLAGMGITRRRKKA